jgi:hypothetical protein
VSVVKPFRNAGECIDACPGSSNDSFIGDPFGDVVADQMRGAAQLPGTGKRTNLCIANGSVPASPAGPAPEPLMSEHHLLLSVKFQR